MVNNGRNSRSGGGGDAAAAAVSYAAAMSGSKHETLPRDHGENSDSGDEEQQLHCASSAADLGPIEYPPDQHRLQQPYWLWFSKRPGPTARVVPPQGTHGYSQALRLVAQVGTVEQWWSLYSHTVRLSSLPVHTDLHLFKVGIRPMWEDQANARGGKWVIRLHKAHIGRAWENLCMAMLGEQFMVGNEICGAVVSVRYQEDLLSLWNRTASDQASTARIRDTLRRILNLPASTFMEYKTHVESLKAFKTSPVTAPPQPQQQPQQPPQQPPPQQPPPPQPKS